MPKVTTFLWFADQAEEAARFYVSLFANSEIRDVMRGGGGGTAGQSRVMSVTFSLDGQHYIAFNGGPHFTFNEAVSIFVACDGQDEVDRLWEALSEGGQKSRCGWLKDRFGLSWQIVPSALKDMMQDPDPEKSGRVVQALMQMSKLDLPTLRRAYAGPDA